MPNSPKVSFNLINNNLEATKPLNGVSCMLARTTSGPVGLGETLINSVTKFRSIYGSEIVPDGSPSNIEKALKGGSKLRIIRVVGSGATENFVATTANAQTPDTIFNISLEDGSIGETAQVLQFAFKAKNNPAEFKGKNPLVKVQTDANGNIFVITYEGNTVFEKALLLNILPEEVAKRLAIDKNARIADKIENASVLFADIVGFTKITSGLDANTIVGALNALYSRIDERAKREGIEKIKTIGDSYMAASGLFGNEAAEKNALAIVNFARGMLKDIEDFNASSDVKLFMRIGINSGSLIAGVIGKTKFVYDIWGDTVNVASRMESSGETSKIHVSEQTMALTKAAIAYSEPVEMEIKGKGVMKTYFISE